jgi:hypothetical protein
MALIKVPQYAKTNAEKGLELRKKQPKSKKFGLTREQAEEKGVASGVERAYQLKREDRIRESTAETIQDFLNRFHGMADEYGYTTKIRGSILLWGGDKDKRFLKYLDRKLDE